MKVDIDGRVVEMNTVKMIGNIEKSYNPCGYYFSIWFNEKPHISVKGMDGEKLEKRRQALIRLWSSNIEKI